MPHRLLTSRIGSWPNARSVANHRRHLLRLSFEHGGIPVPIAHCDYRFGMEMANMVVGWHPYGRQSGLLVQAAQALRRALAAAPAGEWVVERRVG